MPNHAEIPTEIMDAPGFESAVVCACARAVRVLDPIAHAEIPTESVDARGFESAVVQAGSRNVRVLEPIAPSVGYLMHLATMLSRLDATMIELCTPGHRRGRGFALATADAARDREGIGLVIVRDGSQESYR